MKKNIVRIPIFGDPDAESSFPSHISIYSDISNINSPIKYCVGISHDLRRPNRVENIESTIGAHNNLTLNGQCAKLNSA